MKQIIHIVLVAMLLIINGVAAIAQKSNNGQRIPREELAQKQAKYISDRLALESTTSEKFITTYCDYQKEVWALGPNIRISNESSEAETKALMQTRFERSQKILELRQKYYDKYCEFLTPKQIERVYLMEKQMLNQFSKHKNGIHEKK